jgi:hypothetical protein
MTRHRSVTQTTTRTGRSHGPLAGTASSSRPATPSRWWSASKERDARFRNEIVVVRGGKQILLQDSSSNAIELFEPGR